MNATFDGARIHQQELDREIDILRTEKLHQQPGAAPARPRVPRARVGRPRHGQRRDGPRSRVDAPAQQSAGSGGRV